MTTSSKINVTLPKGSTEVLHLFLVGGGGAASHSKVARYNTGGSSGLYTHQTFDISENESLFFDITVGDGGRTNFANGQATTVRFAEQEELLQISGQMLSAPGGKGAGGSGGYKEPLPSFCQVNVTHGERGDGRYHYIGVPIDDEKRAGGGVIVNGHWDGLDRSGSLDGKGYGAGGGASSIAPDGFPGVVVLALCEPTKMEQIENKMRQLLDGRG